ncbi:ser/Thr protein phosphatase superfamily [Pseudovirgaria hyperparasitica]|uniref:Ser/Thr protein phosphatase superfamily n=1 Tax=Pseudovirgaria hyperparasitica TaxID=470096 RepID=A0A6A6WDJ8_9PEZI|nr:ser/Thr protein phosphatase superfamily [Pseudovirgaria hyperparasitica]KAF2760783.1 ser/Thr protein phosphatase superfamily [Pseudovirgaria hyperparasitica]
MVKIQILSDLHLEAPAAYDVFEITPTAEYLALLGDIGYIKDASLITFLRKHLAKFKITFYVLGNHEPYHSSYATCKQHLLALQTETAQQESTGKFVLLDQTRYDLSPTVSILGCTLFSNITAAQKDYVSFGLNDFYHIADWTVETHVQRHESELRWLNAETQRIMGEPGRDRKIIIMTHYSPTVDARAIDPKHKSSNISSGFMTDLSSEACFSSERVAVWAFGHTHFNCDFEHEAHHTRFVTNQRGYYFAQSDGFDPAKTVEL